MSHEIEFINGAPSYVDNGREPAWHGLGESVEGLTFEQAMDKANLKDWNVRVEPLVVNIGSKNYPMDNHQVTVRNNPATGDVEPLAPTGGRYTGVQNEQAFAVASFLEGMGASVETAGSLRGGRQAFMTLLMDKGFVIDPEGAADVNYGYLLLTTSHDGSLAVEASSTWVRVLCANTLDFALPDAERAYKIRHTATAGDRLAEAQQIFLRANGYADALGQEAAALYQTDCTDAAFFDIVSTIYPKPGSVDGPKESKRGLTVWEKKVDDLMSIWKGQTNANITGTMWGALNAMTERLDWHRTARGGDGTALLEAASGLNANITAEKNAIRSLVVETAGV